MLLPPSLFYNRLHEFMEAIVLHHSGTRKGNSKGEKKPQYLLKSHSRSLLDTETKTGFVCAGLEENR